MILVRRQQRFRITNCSTEQRRRSVPRRARHGPTCKSRGLALDPRVDVALFPSQMLPDFVGLQSPLLPFIADSSLWNGEDYGDVA
jgi:hypothetical protein